MMKPMATVHMSEDEVARDLHAALAKDAAEDLASRPAVIESQHVPRHVRELSAARQVSLEVRRQAVQRFGT